MDAKFSSIADLFLLSISLIHFPVPCRTYVPHRFIRNTSHVPFPLLPLIFHILIMKLRITKYSASRMYMQCRMYRLLEFNFFKHIAHLRQQSRNSKLVIFQEKRLYIKVLKCYTLLWVQRRHNCSPAASFTNCVLTLYLLKVHLQTFLSILVTQKCPILSCDTPVANERLMRLYVYCGSTRACRVWISVLSSICVVDHKISLNMTPTSPDLCKISHNIKLRKSRFVELLVLVLY